MTQVLQVRCAVFCVVLLLSAVAWAETVSEYSESSFCRAFLQPGNAERWFFTETRTDADGKVQAFELRFASGPTDAAELRLCLEEEKGLLKGRERGLHPGLERTFRYIQTSDQELSRGRRRLRLAFPDLGPVSADLALRLQMSRDGRLLEKSVLFSSDGALGNAVLEHLDSSLTVEATGEGPGPFTDVLLLKFVNGTMVAFSQSHYVEIPGPTA